MIRWTSFRPLDWLSVRVGATEEGICELSLNRPGGEASEDHELLVEAREQVGRYLRGELTRFELPLDLRGTDFQKRVWDALVEIPYGSTVSYKELAREIGAPNAVRAVGAANGQNPVAIVVPCHRVLAADGSLGGYAAGLDVKSWLLELEATRRTPARPTAQLGLEFDRRSS